jgi:hypothetical protein
LIGTTSHTGRVTIHYNGFLNRGDKFQENVTCTFWVGSWEIIAEPIRL